MIGNSKRCVVALGVAATVSGPAQADPAPIEPVGPPSGKWVSVADDFAASASLQLRAERLSDYNHDDSEQDFLLTRVRVGGKWAPAPWLSLVLELHDARILGEDREAVPPINDDARPNIFADRLDLHRAFVNFATTLGSVPVHVRIGRQKFNIGDKRLIASLEWVNTARVWDGIRVTLGAPKERQLELFASRVVPVTPGGFNDYEKTGNRHFDSFFHGVYFFEREVMPSAVLEAYWLLRHTSDTSAEQVHTLGARIDGKVGPLAYDAHAALQLGNFGGQSHVAYMAHLGLGYSMKQGAILARYNLASGDSDPDDDVHETFDNLYPLNHPYYGLMDRFSLQNIHHLELAIRQDVMPWLGARASLGSFWLANPTSDAWYSAGLAAIRQADGPARSHVGTELDLTLTIKPWKPHLAILLGYSHLFAGGYIADTGPANDADFVYAQTALTW